MEGEIMKQFPEERTYPFEVTEVREKDGVTTIDGYAAVFNKLSDDLGGFKEKIKRGFFSNVLEDDVRALFNHDSNWVLGRTTNNTLTLNEDNKGLGVSVIPPNTTQARDVITLVERGDINQMSFQWITEEDKWDESDMSNVVRTLIKAKELLDVSLVTFPAYPQTTADVRSARQVFKWHLEELQEQSAKNEKEKYGIEKITIMRKKLDLKEDESKNQLIKHLIKT